MHQNNWIFSFQVPFTAEVRRSTADVENSPFPLSSDLVPALSDFCRSCHSVSTLLGQHLLWAPSSLCQPARLPKRASTVPLGMRPKYSFSLTTLLFSSFSVPTLPALTFLVRSCPIFLTLSFSFYPFMLQ